MNLRNLAIWGVIIVALIAVYGVMQGQGRSAVASSELTYSQLLTRVDAGEIKQVRIKGASIEGVDRENRPFKVVGPGENDPDLNHRMQTHNVDFGYQPAGQNLIVGVLLNMLPLLLLAG